MWYEGMLLPVGRGGFCDEYLEQYVTYLRLQPGNYKKIKRCRNLQRQVLTDVWRKS